MKANASRLVALTVAEPVDRPSHTIDPVLSNPGRATIDFERAALGFLSMVTVSAQSKGEDWVCEVTVDDAGQRTRHTVTVKRADLQRWGGANQRDDVESLVERSFEFLLEREPPHAILATFDLSVIQHYFPEYDAAFRR